MKKQLVATLVIAAATFAISHTASAASPFTVGGEKIAALFNSPKIWKVIFSSVETLEAVRANRTETDYKFSTTEQVPMIDAQGRMTGYTPTACTVTATVSNVGDEFVPKWEVSAVDFSACPAFKP